MAALTVQTESITGFEFTGNAAAAGGDTFANDGKTRFYVRNGDASSKTVTFVTTQTVLGLAVADLAVVVAASKTAQVGPLPVATFGATVSVTYSDVTSVTVDVVKQAG